MSRSSMKLDEALNDYLVAHGSPPTDIQQSLIAETARLGEIANMQIAPEQGAFMTMLTRLLDVRRAVEVGTFTGYSALCIAMGLPDDGRLVCCDISEEWTAIGRRHWERAGVADKIDLRIGPALETLAAIPSQPPFDLGFIDADKKNYAGYYEALLRLMRPGGLILVDNVLWSGRVLAPEDDDGRAIAEFNDLVLADPRVDTVMLPIADGLTMLRVRS